MSCWIVRSPPLPKEGPTCTRGRTYLGVPGVGGLLIGHWGSYFGLFDFRLEIPTPFPENIRSKIIMRNVALPARGWISVRCKCSVGGCIIEKASFCKKTVFALKKTVGRMKRSRRDLTHC